MGKPVVHFEITGTNTKSLSAFYSELFDWKVNHFEEMNYGMVDTGQEGKIAGGIGGSDDPNAHGVVIYIEVDDLQAYLDKAESLGARRSCRWKSFQTWRRLLSSSTRRATASAWSRTPRKPLHALHPQDAWLLAGILGCVPPPGTGYAILF